MQHVSPELGPVDLKREQERTLKSARRAYGLLARLLFVTMDLFYTRKRSLRKFKVLEVVARMPYQAWENVAYVALTHKYRAPEFARRIFEFVEEARHQQDNEQWHLLILEELMQRRDIKQGFIRFRLLPQIMAFVFYHISWFLYVIRPSLSYHLNADFEDHAEHEYMAFVRDDPALEAESWQTSFEQDYGPHASLADLLRHIGLDERHHKEQSLERIARARFA
ncbi:alternative oxidase [Myxococcota bacterium]